MHPNFQECVSHLCPTQLDLRWICAFSRHRFKLRTLCCTNEHAGSCSSVGQALLWSNREREYNSLCMLFFTCQLFHNESKCGMGVTTTVMVICYLWGMAKISFRSSWISCITRGPRREVCIMYVFPPKKCVSRASSDTHYLQVWWALQCNIRRCTCFVAAVDVCNIAPSHGSQQDLCSGPLMAGGGGTQGHAPYPAAIQVGTPRRWCCVVLFF